MTSMHTSIVALLLIIAIRAELVAAETVTKEKVLPPAPVPVDAGKVSLAASNTTIQFVGTHVGPEPNPRTGYFTRFKGELVVDEATQAPTAASVHIDTPSLTTPIARLTGHLHSPDFFDVRQFPKASFKSTRVDVVDAAAGKFEIVGDLTIRDVTKPISIPVETRFTDDGVVLTSKFRLKRSQFGMTFGPDRVVDDVTMTITVGRPTPKVEMQ